MSEQSLSEIFKSYMDTFGKIYEEVIKTNNRSHEYGNFVRHTIPDAICSSIDLTGYKIEGSCSRGNWTPVPWIGIFDTRITTRASSGVYIVYLLNKDTHELYLTLNQAATEASKNENGGHGFANAVKSKNKIMISGLKGRAELIRNKLNVTDLFTEEINSGSPAYDAGCICYIKYSSKSVPPDRELVSDLRKFLDIYKNYYDVFFSSTKIEAKESEKKVPIATKKSIEQVKDYIESKGFSYNNNLIENFFLSLKSKPFVILAGTSGTGKTRLVKLFAEAIRAEFRLVSVRPDWSDGSDLFGHNDLNGKFIAGPVCECFDIAEKNPTKPVFLCLDEMNLARVEYYLSDFLSVIESREKTADGNIITQPIAQYKDGIPDNLYIVGTVNMDETTFPFSKKVLDRANTIEFSFVNLMPNFEASADNSVEKADVDNDFLRTKYLVLTKDCSDEKDYVEKICEKLEALNKILLAANAHVGYRVRDEIAFYMLNNKKAGNLLEDNVAFDYEIMQKILPRIQGSSAAIKNMLIELYKYCCNNVSGIDSDSKDIGIQMEKQASSAIYPVSAAKIGYMMTRYEEDGFTSYWL